MGWKVVYVGTASINCLACVNMKNKEQQWCVTNRVAVHFDSSHPALVYVTSRRSLQCWCFWSKVYVCGRSTAGIVGSNPAEGMDVSMFWVLCVVRERSVRRADHSSRGALPTFVRRCVWSRNLKNEVFMTLVGPQRKFVAWYQQT